MEVAVAERSAKTERCPFCFQEIRANATKCKHCGSAIARVAVPEHGGTCPSCREEIHPEALKCQHCRSWLAADFRDEPAQEGVLVVAPGDGAIQTLPQLGPSWLPDVPMPGYECRNEFVCGWEYTNGLIVTPGGPRILLGWFYTCGLRKVCTKVPT